MTKLSKPPKKSLIERAVSEALSIRVARLQRIRRGLVNHVYKAETGKGNYIIRIFNYSDWPEDGMLEWIEKQLAKQRIPHAKLVFYTRSKKYFPNGFMISKFIEGADGWTASKRNTISKAARFYGSGKLLCKIHQIQGSKYGSFNKGRGTHKDFIRFKSDYIKPRLQTLIRAKFLPASIKQDFERVIREYLLPFQKRFKPVLIHSDAHGDNLIITPKGNFVLIDWDNARFGIALEDFTNLTAWFPISEAWHSLKQRAIARSAFLKGYGDIGFTKKEIAKLEKALHPIYSLGVLKYYFSGLKDMKHAKKIRSYLFRLLGRKS